MISFIITCAIAIALSVIFCILDIKYRMIPHKVMIPSACIMIPLIVWTYATYYLPNFGWMSIIWGVIGVVLPFIWYLFMKKWIGEMDLKWLMIIFALCPFGIIYIIMGMIVFTLIMWVICHKKTKIMPAMIPITLSLIMFFIISLI